MIKYFYPLCIVSSVCATIMLSVQGNYIAALWAGIAAGWMVFSYVAEKSRDEYKHMFDTLYNEVMKK